LSLALFVILAGGSIASAEEFSDKWIGTWSRDAVTQEGTRNSRAVQRVNIEKLDSGGVKIDFYWFYSTDKGQLASVDKGDTSSGVSTYENFFGDANKTRTGTVSIANFKLNTRGDVLRFQLDHRPGDIEPNWSATHYYYLGTDRRLWAISKEEANMEADLLVKSINARRATAIVLKFEGEF